MVENLETGVKRLFSVKIRGAFLMFFIALVSSTTLLGDTAHAGRAQAANDPDARNQIIALCAQGLPLAFGAFVSNGPNLDLNTGGFNYQVAVYYSRCANSGNTRAFALNGKAVFCPLAGNYAGPNGGENAYDCVKYVSNPRYTDGGGLKCGSQNNAACTAPGFFSSGVGVEANQPPVGVLGVYNTQNQAVPNWNAAKQSAGSYSISRNDAFCMYYKAGKNWGNINSSIACQDFGVTVSWPGWDLTPTVSGPSGNVSTDTVLSPAKATVTNYQASQSQGSQWRFGRKVIAPGGASLPGAADNGTDPASYYGSGWQLLGAAAQNFNPGATDVATDSLGSLSSYPVGTKICWTNSVYLYRPTFVQGAGWRHSQPRCITIGTFPAFSVQNGDVRAGGSFSVNGNSCTVQNSTLKGLLAGHSYGPGSGRGSYGQYGALSAGFIKNIGTSNFRSSDSATLYRTLLFGSRTRYTPNLVSDGLFYQLSSANTLVNTTTHCLPNLDASYPSPLQNTPVGANMVENVGITGVSSQNTQYTFTKAASGTSYIDIPAVSLTDGQRVAIKVNGPSDCSGGRYVVRLTGSITRASSSFANVSSLPSFALITTSSCIRVVITDTVSEINGLIGSAGDFMTCQGGGSGFDGTNSAAYGPSGQELTVANCATPLTVSGASVVGGRVYAYRTNGDGTDSAETFSLDPLFSLGDYARARQSGAVITDSQAELPPRY